MSRRESSNSSSPLATFTEHILIEAVHAGVGTLTILLQEPLEKPPNRLPEGADENPEVLLQGVSHIAKELVELTQQEGTSPDEVMKEFWRIYREKLSAFDAKAEAELQTFAKHDCNSSKHAIVYHDGREHRRFDSTLFEAMSGYLQRLAQRAEKRELLEEIRYSGTRQEWVIVFGRHGIQSLEYLFKTPEWFEEE